MTLQELNEKKDKFLKQQEVLINTDVDKEIAEKLEEYRKKIHAERKAEIDADLARLGNYLDLINELISEAKEKEAVADEKDCALVAEEENVEATENQITQEV